MHYDPRPVRANRTNPQTPNIQTPNIQTLTTSREALHDEDAEGHREVLAALRGGAPARHALLPLVWDGGPVSVNGSSSGGGGGVA